MAEEHPVSSSGPRVGDRDTQHSDSCETPQLTDSRGCARATGASENSWSLELVACVKQIMD